MRRRDTHFLLVVLCCLLLISFAGCAGLQGGDNSREEESNAFDHVKWDESVPADDYDTSSYFEEGGKESLETEDLDT